MNEGAKTGIFWVVALVMIVVALFISQTPENESSSESIVGQPLFPTFTDPLAASSLRIVTFNEEQGELAKFEVAKDEQTGVWSLPSRNNYPADAAEQMKNAANVLVGVKVLDIQTENPEDHADLGVLEPNVESLEAGDEGVGRMVTLKGANNATLASIIIGNAEKGSEGKRYVRVPGQDRVYAVKLDDKPLSIKFEDWIEKDLLQLSSIDISNVEIQNYDASLSLGNQLALEKHYDAKLSIDGGNNWVLDELAVYDEQGEKKETKLAEGEKLATAKLNSLKNALDDLKIVDVAAKPKGMSENLKADKDLVSDQQAVLSLAQRGFFPVTQGDILSANGEMVVTLKDGVQYVLRFGNVKGIEESEADEKQAAEGEQKQPEVAGSNRYLLVTTRVDESKFPPPELASIPKSIEEMEAADAAEAKAAADAANPPAALPSADAEESTDLQDAAPKEEMQQPAEVSEPQSSETPKNDEPKPAEPSEAAEQPADAEKPADAAPEADTPDSSPEEDSTESNAPEGDATEGTVEQSGEAEASGSGQGQEQDQDAPAAAEQTEATSETPADDESETDKPETDKPETDKPETDKPEADKPAAAEPAEEPAPTADKKTMTAEEKQERLEAEQEKLTKENQRKLDERKDKVEAARRRVRELNGRFADWYYVIPEATYRNLRLSRDELIEKTPSAAAPAAPGGVDEATESPAFSIPGLGQ